jgi:imidazolonepropionase-like amidohydrolase
MNTRLIVGSALVLVSSLGAGVAPPSSDDPGAAPVNGPRHAEVQRWALVGATVHVKPGETIEDAAVLFDDGVIVSVGGADVDALEADGWRIEDVTGRHVYAGFVEPFAQVDGVELSSERAGGHWCEVFTPERRALAGEGLTDSDRERLRGNGFVAAAISPKGGVMRGLGAVVSTAEVPEDASEGRASVYGEDVYLACAIESANGFRAYPTSHMGAVALIRQGLSDAAWWRDNGEPGPSYLEAIDPGKRALWFDTKHELEGLLAGKIGREFDLGADEIVIVGNGTELRRLDAVAGLGYAVVVPLRFPAAPDVASVAGLERTTFNDLMLWEQGPSNARRLAEAGVTVAITSSKLPKGQQFWGNLRRAVEAGLGTEDALAMVTTTPAELVGVEDRLGTIEAGKVASFVVTDGAMFDGDGEILDVWVEGRKYVINEADDDTLDGAWTVGVVGGSFEMGLVFDGGKIRAIEGDAENDARKVEVDLPSVSFLIDDEDDGTGTYVMSGVLVEDRLVGTGVSPDGSVFEWFATRDVGEAVAGEADDDDDEEIEAAPEDLGGVPFGAYAMAEVPAQESVLFVNGTVWTQGDAGIIESGFVWIADGKIRAVGPMDEAPDVDGVRVVDLAGRQISPGLIDAHSHTGLFGFGVNEAGQAVTAECRIGDSLDPGHINWYRQLAGGVTTANLLHGSANPIGGQSQIVKVRWGSQRAEDMFFEGAMPGIKFALGENVKQSNWGDRFTTRYPQTRMGVETLMRDRFAAARDYAAGHERRDLELEALAEILAGDRLVHSHSYRQDEILMLCRIAEDFGFQIGTFQHGLEVYKVAEAVRAHARGASIFSDWWAYKVEVQDAIPYAGPVQTRAGVRTSYNSDSDELARRMSWEAGKAVKYSDGKVVGADALAFVTINPAVQLGIEDRVGSIEVGKDADLAIWTGSPLSSLSRCVGTWIDGREYFSVEKDEAHRARIKAERERLIQKVLEAPGRDGDADADDDEGEEPERVRAYRALIDQLRRGDLGEQDGCVLIDHEARLLRMIGE